MLKPIVLKNGLTILRIPRSGSKIFVTGFVTPTGSVIEEGYFPQGVSRIVERLFWCGTDKHPSTRSLNVTLESLGGNFSSFTSQESTQFYLTVPSYNQFKAVSMLAEIIQRSYFDSRDVENEKRNLIEQLKSISDDLEAESTLAALSTLYSQSSLGLPISGTVDSLSAITQSEVLEYLAHQYQPSRSYLILAGDFDNKPIVELAEQEWAIWNPRSKKYIEAMNFHNEDVEELPRIVYRQRGIAKTQLSLSFLLNEGLRPYILLNNSEEDTQKIDIDEKQLVDTKLTDFANILVLNTILGQGLSSRLWTKGVEEELLFHHVESEILRYKSTGCLQISGQTDNIQFSFALESILSVLEALKKTTVSINELAKAKSYLKGKFILEQENLLSAITWQIEHFLGSGLFFTVEDLLEKIDTVEAPAIRTLALDLFVPERMVISTVGTAKETRLVDKLIKKYLS